MKKGVEGTGGGDGRKTHRKKEHATCEKKYNGPNIVGAISGDFATDKTCTLCFAKLNLLWLR